jgi:hypothetical protein
MQDCATTLWSAWTICACNGQQRRDRTITQYPTNGGRACPTIFQETNPCVAPADCAIIDEGDNSDADDPMSKNAGGIPVWAWIVIGIFAVIIIAAVIGVVIWKTSTAAAPSQKYTFY